MATERKILCRNARGLRGEEILLSDYITNTNHSTSVPLRRRCINTPSFSIMVFKDVLLDAIAFLIVYVEH